MSHVTNAAQVVVESFGYDCSCCGNTDAMVSTA